MAVQIAIVGASPLSAALAKLVRDATDLSLALWAERTTADHIEQTVGRDGVALLAVPPGESREFIIGLYRRAWAHADETIELLPLDAIGHVPWWPADKNEVTLHHILVRVATETSRHAGHADIVRELIDGAAGLAADRSNLPPGGQASWQAYRDRVERAAQEAARGSA